MVGLEVVLVTIRARCLGIVTPSRAFGAAPFPMPNLDSLFN